MKVQKNAAVALFVALGLKNADKWNDARTAAKLGKIKEMVDEDVKLEGDDQVLLDAVLAAAAKGEEFEVVAEEAAELADEPKAEKAASNGGGKRAVPRKMKAGGKGNHEYSGQVLAEFGLSDEITQEMVDRHCALRGKVNDDAVDYLTYAWKIITAYNAAKAVKKAG